MIKIIIKREKKRKNIIKIYLSGHENKRNEKKNWFEKIFGSKIFWIEKLNKNKWRIEKCI